MTTTRKSNRMHDYYAVNSVDGRKFVKTKLLKGVLPRTKTIFNKLSVIYTRLSNWGHQQLLSVLRLLPKRI